MAVTDGHSASDLLPTELWHTILGTLSPKVLVSASQVCVLWAEICQDFVLSGMLKSDHFVSYLFLNLFKFPHTQFFKHEKTFITTYIQELQVVFWRNLGWFGLGAWQHFMCPNDPSFIAKLPLAE